MPKPINTAGAGAPDRGTRPVLGADAEIVAFERARQKFNRSKRRYTAVFSLLFVLAVVGLLYVSEVSLTHLAEGLPGLVAYIAGTLPTLRADSFAADVAE